MKKLTECLTNIKVKQYFKLDVVEIHYSILFAFTYVQNYL